MSWVNPSSKLRSSPETGRRTSVRWWLPLFLALALGGLVAGVVVAQTNPDWIDWYGTKSASLSDDDGSLRALWPAIAAGAPERMMVAWSDRVQSAEAKRNLYLAFSGDNGGTWSAPQVITTPLHSVLLDAIIVGDRYFVAWMDLQTEVGQPSALYEAEVTQSGDVVAMRPIPSPVVLQPAPPRLAASEDELHVVFNGGDPSSIMYAARPLTATAWPTATVITSTGANGGSWLPSLVVDPDGETLHMVWEERILGDPRKVMYMRWSASGTDVEIFSPAGTTETNWIQPSIGADSDGNLHVIWGEQVGEGGPEELDQYVRYTRYDAGSESWTLPPERIFSEHVKVNGDDPRDVSPSLALKEEGDQIEICVAWHGFREYTPEWPTQAEAEEVLLSCSGDGGETWSEPWNMSRSYEHDPATTTDVSIIPAITFDTMGHLHGVWQERTEFTGGISYYEVYHTSAVHVVFMPLVVRS